MFHYVRDPNLTFPWFLDFWTPGAPYLLFLLYQNAPEIIRKYIGTFLKHIIFHIWTSSFVNFGKDGHREIPKIRLIKSPKSWIWDQYLSINMNGCLLIWYQYPYQNIKWHFLEFFKFDNFEIIFLDTKRLAYHRVLLRKK